MKLLILPLLLALANRVATDVLGTLETATETLHSNMLSVDPVFRGAVEQATSVTIAEPLGANLKRVAKCV